MEFREAMERYRAGCASEEEKRIVEAEVEKNRLIAEYLDESWGKDWTEEAESTMRTEETKTLRRALRRRGWKTIFLSVLLATAIFFGATFGLVPLLEKQYWNPEESSYGDPFSTDLSLTLSAYGELFSVGRSISYVNSKRTGFADYDITIQYWGNSGGEDGGYVSARLHKGELTLPMDLFQTVPVNVFAQGSYPTYTMSEEHKAEVYAQLKALPDYVQVHVAATFAEDMTMEELAAFERTLTDGYITWVGIRNAPKDRQRYPLCGMSPFSGGIVREGINEVYPFFEIKGENRTAENLEQHFKSLLRYSFDREEAGKGAGGAGDKYYYEEVLAYVEEQGIASYGCYLAAKPSEILALLDSGMFTQVWPDDAWIDF